MDYDADHSGRVAAILSRLVDVGHDLYELRCELQDPALIAVWADVQITLKDLVAWQLDHVPHDTPEAA